MVSAEGGSIAAGRDVKHAVSIRTTVLPPEALKEAAEAQAPPDLTNIPYPHGFVGRAEQLTKLDDAFARSGEVVVQAIHGLGGVGKSTLAAHWARTRSCGSPQWWITAESAEALDRGLTDFALAVRPVLRTVGMGSDELREWALQWLGSHRDWLIVLDNVHAPADVRGLLDRIGRSGRVLITSRRSTGWHQLATTIPLDVLGEGEAVELFTRILDRDGPSADGVDEVCAELGRLPLALEQAAAYCAETGVSPRDYLTLLQDRPAEMFATTAEGGDGDRTIARVWSLTLDRLAKTPPALDAFHVLAWFAPDGIPRHLLDDLAYPAQIRPKITEFLLPCQEGTGSLHRRMHDWGRSLVKQAADPLALNRALGRLVAYSMITERDGALGMHRLVQALARTPAPRDPHRRSQDIAAARRIAERALLKALPTNVSEPSSWPTWLELLPHAVALTEHTPADLESAATGEMLSRTSVFQRDHGAYAAALRTAERACAITERYEETDSHTVIHGREVLASAYAKAEKPARALPMRERIFADFTRTLGPDHDCTLTAQYILATTYLSAGDPARGISMLERNLANRERVLGPEHPKVLISRISIAEAYDNAGEPELALSLHESNLADAVRLLGPDERNVLAARESLSRALIAMGDKERALALAEENLAESERILGPEHPETLKTRGLLAQTYEETSGPASALPILERNLAGRERTLGTDHPATLTSRNNLANAYQSVQDFDRAIRIHQRNLDDRERLFGTDHPATLATYNNLGAAYQNSGDPETAVPLLERAYSGRKRAFGPDHPQTLTSCQNLAIAYLNSGHPDPAVTLLEDTLADFQRALGPQHQKTRTAREILETARRAARRSRPRQSGSPRKPPEK
ncbi:tetratricopeptide repeat protein [Streptomyces sp. NPDC060187]|uniref:tetratricopeptide repeat protein n=1 Tax=Streptomyces sp. NPDC060187 TaxID=3347067 RepID=UPI00364A2E68